MKDAPNGPAFDGPDGLLYWQPARHLTNSEYAEVMRLGFRWRGKVQAWVAPSTKATRRALLRYTARIEYTKRRENYDMKEYKEIPLSRGCVAKVSPCDFELVGKYKWSTWVDSKGQATYAGRNEYSNGRRVKTIKMHRFIMEAKDGEFVDHINRDKLDNRRENLRIATRAENGANRSKLKGKNKYRGVYWHPDNKNWIARIRQTHLGSFDSQERAAMQYDRAALEIYGEFAVLNIPEKIEDTKKLPFTFPQKKTSRYRGVSLEQRTGRWAAFIAVNRKTINLGSYADEEAAARVYDAAARQYFGERARCNFPD